jgi:hypothetical protein
MTAPELKVYTPEHDQGPWESSADGKTISSNDFTHDVILRVSGDFYDDAQRKRYSDNLAVKLTAPAGESAQPWVQTADRLPREDETINGRVPAIDVEGYLITALLAGNSLVGNGLPIVRWLPVSAPAA